MLPSLSSCLNSRSYQNMAGLFLAPGRRVPRKLTFRGSIEVGVGDLHLLYGVGEALGEGVVDPVLHQDAVGAHAGVWPALWYFEAIAPLTAISISASSKTMNGALPPSSRDNFLAVPAHCCISNLPTSVEPVKVSLRRTSYSGRHYCSVRFGSPKSLKSRVIRPPVPGLSNVTIPE
jgi:hypothetical protein